jgi:hypothetical protein
VHPTSLHHPPFRRNGVNQFTLYEMILRVTLRREVTDADDKLNRLYRLAD